MNLYLLRHGDAQNFDPGIHQSDDERALTSSGKEKMKQEAAGMKALGIRFDRIISSPYKRAKETAEIVAKGTGYESEIGISENLTPSSSTAKLIDEIATEYSEDESILLASHEPFLSDTISRLLANHPRLAIRMQKGSLCKLVLENGAATLSWLMTAEQLSAGA